MRVSGELSNSRLSECFFFWNAHSAEGPDNAFAAGPGSGVERAGTRPRRMERLLTHPATAPLVHADHTHRAALPLASRPSAATGAFYEETSIGRVDCAPWTFEIGRLPLNNESPPDNYFAYKHCYTARNMSNIRDAVEEYFGLPPERAFHAHQRGRARIRQGTAFPRSKAGGRLSPYFVVMINDTVEKRQFR